jgi:hypothetical protein
MTDNRISELLQWAEEEGRTLPYAAEAIIALEEQGAVVDLLTGAVYRVLMDAPLTDGVLRTPGAPLTNAGG